MLLHQAGQPEPYLLRTVDMPLREIASSELRVQRLKHLIAQRLQNDVDAGEAEPAAPPPEGFEWRRTGGSASSAKR
jgi:hypothetical protein